MKKQRSEQIQITLSNLPKKPGVYQFFDKEDKIIYVGKAKVLKNRVSSYFSKNKYENRKTEILVRKIERIEYIIVETEFDALLLENTLIKELQPKYNIQLRDDKSYPWICIKNERFPRVFSTFQVIKDGSEYYGPFASVKMKFAVLDLIRKLYKPRTCSHKLSTEHIKQRKYRLCLEYQIGNCLGGCEGLQTVEDYNQNIQEIRSILKGNIQSLIKPLKEKMIGLAENLEFELAQEIKEKIQVLEKYQARSTVVNPSIHNVDVFSIVTDINAAYVNFMKINNGSVIQSSTVEMKKKLDETEEELLIMAVAELRSKFESTSREIYLSNHVDLDIPNVKIFVPKIGEKKKLIEFSLRNAKYYMKERHKQLEKIDPDRHSNRLMEQMQKDLRLTEWPKHIECFDNSNFQGAYPVAACVVFKNGKPAKKEYRHFNIKTVVGPDDFASMEEVVFRRYKRLLNENSPLPQLIVIDGGKGQLGAALNALEKLELRGKIAIIGIAKRLEEIYYPGDSLPLYLDKKSETLKTIQQLRNEAHRFGITFHRSKRDKGTLKSELHDIKGIGNATVEELLQNFKSVKKVKEATKEQLAEVIGPAKAKLIKGYFE